MYKASLNTSNLERDGQLWAEQNWAINGSIGVVAVVQVAVNVSVIFLEHFVPLNISRLSFKPHGPPKNVVDHVYLFLTTVFYIIAEPLQPAG